MGSVVAEAPPGDKNVQPVTLRTSVTQTALLLSSKVHLDSLLLLMLLPRQMLSISILFGRLFNRVYKNAW